MDTQKGNNVMLWAKANRFLIGFIILLMIALAVVGGLYTNLLFSLGLLPQFVLIGILVWSIYTRKKGAIMIALGATFAWIALVSWIAFLHQGEFDISFFGFDILVTLLSALLFYFVIKGFRQSSAEQHH